MPGVDGRLSEEMHSGVPAVQRAGRGGGEPLGVGPAQACRKPAWEHPPGTPELIPWTPGKGRVSKTGQHSAL